MDISAITQAISAVGFPVVMCLGLLWFLREQIKTHSEEVAKMTEAINSNTIVMTKIAERLGQHDT